MKERSSRAVWICAVILCALMAVIFLLSAQPASESAQSSGRIVDFVIHTFFPDRMSLPARERILFRHQVSVFVRKAAHFSEFLLLGAAWMAQLEAIRCLRPLRRAPVWAWLLGTLYAVTDELHQLFVPGRSAGAVDVLIDSAGVLCGVMLLCLALRLFRREKPV